jgi:hypothetical protein
MKIRFIAIVLFISLAFSVQSGNVPSAFKTDVVVDGQNKEWTSPLPRFDKTTGINFDVSNDDHNLSFILRIADEAIQRQIMENGLDVWINKDGKKKKITGITYPMPMSKPKTGANGPDKTGTKPNKGENNFGGTPQSNTGTPPLLMTNELTLTGFLLENGKQPVRGCSIQVAIKQDPSNCLIYELSVPFNTFWKESMVKEDLGQKMTIGFVVRAAESTESQKSDVSGGMTGGPDGMMGGPGGGGGMMGGPDGGGGGMMGGPDGMSRTAASTNQEKKFWFKVELNVPK